MIRLSAATALTFAAILSISACSSVPNATVTTTAADSSAGQQAQAEEQVQRAANAYDRLAEAPDWLIPSDMQTQVREARAALTSVPSSQVDDLLSSQSEMVMTVSVHLYMTSEKLTKERDLLQTDSYAPSRTLLGEWLPPQGPSKIDGNLVSIIATTAADFAEVMTLLPVRNHISAPVTAPPAPTPPPPAPVTVNASPGYTESCQTLGDVLLVQQFAPGQTVDITATGPWAATVSADGTVTVHTCND